MKRALDLFCCAGGATRGLEMAGYHVTGVDNRPQPRYVGDVFHQDDALAWLKGEREPLCNFDLIWASPPCQRYSQLTPVANKPSHPDLLPIVLDILRAQPTPYIVENVQGTQHLMQNPIFLCGTMFGLNIWRHRWFELGNVGRLFFMLPPCNHEGHPVLVSGTTRRRENGKRREHNKCEVATAIGIDWMIRTDLDEAIPPAYSKFLAEQIDSLAPRAPRYPPANWRDLAPWCDDFRIVNGVRVRSAGPLYYQDEAGVVWRKKPGVTWEYERWNG